MRSFQRALVRFESILSEISWVSRRLYFFLFRKYYIHISFLIFWNSMNLAYVSKFRDKDFVSDYVFTSQKEPHCVPDMDFLAIPSFILSHLKLCRTDLPKLTSSILMKIVTIPVILVDEVYFYMHHSIKTWLFEKIIFGIVCLCIFI